MKSRLDTLLILASICFVVFSTVWLSPALSSRPEQPTNSSNPWASPDMPPLPTTNATVKASPSNITVTVGTNVTISFMISDAIDVYAWQLYVRWNPSVLRFAALASGDFLNKDEDVEITRIPDEYVDIQIGLSKVENDTGAMRVYRNYIGESKMLIGETRLGPHSGISGNGTLCSVIFEVIGQGSTAVDIATSTDFSSYVLDSYIRELPSIMQNGFITGT